MSTRARRIRSASLTLLFVFCVALAGADPSQAREVEVDGTADCGLVSNHRCSIEGTLAIWTDDVTGTRE